MASWVEGWEFLFQEMMVQSTSNYLLHESIYVNMVKLDTPRNLFLLSFLDRLFEHIHQNHLPLYVWKLQIFCFFMFLFGDIFNSSRQTNLFGDYQHQRLCHLSSMDSLTEGRGYKHQQLRPESPSLEVDIHPGAPSPSDTMDHILVPCAGDFCKPSFGNHLGSYYWGGENTKRCKYTCICNLYKYTRTLWDGTSTHSWFLVWYCW